MFVPLREKTLYLRVVYILGMLRFYFLRMSSVGGGCAAMLLVLFSFLSLLSRPRAGLATVSSTW